jgi:hypothetical protein
MRTARPSAGLPAGAPQPSRVPRPGAIVPCGTCGQRSLQLFLAEGVESLLLVGYCADCDAGHCPHCGRHTSTCGLNCYERTCLECGTSLALYSEAGS